MTGEKQLDIKPRYSFKKQMVNIEGNQKFQVKDISQSDDIKLTTESYKKWCQTEIIRELKEDFLNVCDEVLQLKQSDA